MYLYRLSAPVGTPFGQEGSSWLIDNKLFASDGAPNDRFGWAVAVSQSDAGDGTVTVIVGARGDDNAGSNSGSAYVTTVPPPYNTYGIDTHILYVHIFIYVLKTEQVTPNGYSAAPPPPPATVHPLATDCDKCSSFADFYRCSVPSKPCQACPCPVPLKKTKVALPVRHWGHLLGREVT